MTQTGSSLSVERLFPFVLRSRILLVGRETLRRRRSRLHFVLMTTDLSAGSRAEILQEFDSYPIVQHYTSTDLERLFNARGAKVIGFARSALAQSILTELKVHRIHQPAISPKPRESSPVPPTARKARQAPASRRRGRR